MALAGSSVVTPDAAHAARGYTSRACGFDMNRNGVIGESADCQVCDGVTTDVDGNGVADVLKYVDCQNGSDTAGNGAPNSPFKTIQGAMDALAAPSTNQIQAVCFKGTCSETVLPTQSGAAGAYTRSKSGSEDRTFDYPRYPLILAGWDVNRNGVYPPHDAAEVALLDGNVSANLTYAINNNTSVSRSNLEIAHFTARDYNMNCADPGGFMHAGSRAARLYVHDMRLAEISAGCFVSSGRIVFYLFGAPDFLAVENLEMANFGSFFVRGVGTAAGSPDAGPWRFKNLTLKAKPANNDTVTGFKFWGYLTGVEILDSILDSQVGSAWTCSGCPSNSTAIHPAQCSRNVTARNNLLLNWAGGFGVQPNAVGYCDNPGRSMTNIVFDRNEVRITTNPWPYGHFGIQVERGPTINNTVENLTISNNMITSSAGYSGCIWSNAGNNGGVNAGVVNIVGNTCSGSVVQWYQLSIGDITGSGPAYPQQNYVVKDNIIQGGGTNVWTRYAPGNITLDGNKYDPAGNFVWAAAGPTSFTTWKTTAQEGNTSASCRATFVDAAAGNFHLAATDTCAKDGGTDASAVSSVDIDQQTRPYGVAWDSGADEHIPSSAPVAPTLLGAVALP
jgi:hypothetical protein